MQRSSYTVDFKLSVVDWVQNNEKSIRAASRQFGVDRKCVRKWLREKDVLGCARVMHGPRKRKLHAGRCPLSQELDELVLGSIQQQQERGEALTNQDLKSAALHASQLLGLRDFKASPSWLRAWKQRNGFSCGERLSQEDCALVTQCQPSGSSLISHVASTDEVRLLQSPPQRLGANYNSTSDEMGNGSEGKGNESTEVLPGTAQQLCTAVISGEEVQRSLGCLDHSYSRPPAEEPFPTKPHQELQTSATALLMPDGSYGDILGASLKDSELSEKSSQELLADLVPMYHEVETICDPIISSTHVGDSMCGLDIALEVTAGPSNDRELSLLPSPATATSLMTSLSPPRRTSTLETCKLWPTLGYGLMSPATDPLTGLLGNRLSQPVFPAGPEILYVDMFNNPATSSDTS